MIVGIVIGVLIVVIIAIVAGVFIYKKKYRSVPTNES